MASHYVLVTGASGYIAKHLVLRLLNAGHKVRGSVRSEARGEEIRADLTPHLDDADKALARLDFVALDLGHDAGWDAAMDGIDVVMHTASPFPMVQPKDEQDTIRPAVDGALRALRAAKAAGVKRVILTSSIVAIYGKDHAQSGGAFTEEDWSDTDKPGATPYLKSKTFAERAAWDFVRDQAPEIALTTINPGLVLGAPIGSGYGTSVAVIERILKAQDPMLPNLGFSLVDVGDIAEMHIRAMDRPESIGKRFIGAERSMWFVEIAQTIKDAMPHRKIVTRRAPNVVVRMLALFDPAIRSILPDLGQRKEMSNAQARDILAMEFRDTRDSIRETAAFLDEKV